MFIYFLVIVFEIKDFVGNSIVSSVWGCLSEEAMKHGNSSYLSSQIVGNVFDIDTSLTNIQLVLDTVDLSYSDLIGCDLEETVSPPIMCN